MDQINAEVDSNPLLSVPVAPETSILPGPSGTINAASANVGATAPIIPPWSLPMTASTVMGANVAMPSSLRIETFPSSNVGPEISPLLPTQQKDRRGSFGSTFAGSSGTGGNGGGGNGTVGVGGVLPSVMPTSAVFKMDLKPKEPPIFRGTATEDVDTWLAKVEDFIYLTEANTRQQVAYMAMLLQDAAGDWWTALLKERHGTRPVDYAEMSVLSTLLEAVGPVAYSLWIFAQVRSTQHVDAALPMLLVARVLHSVSSSYLHVQSTAN